MNEDVCVLNLSYLDNAKPLATYSDEVTKC